MSNSDFNININIDNFTKGVQDWERTQIAIIRGIASGQEEFVERLRLKAIQYLGIYGLGNSALAASLMIIHTSTGAIISCGADYACFVEYGTGMMGENNPHPKPIGWNYSSGENSSTHEGWWYPTTASDPNPYKHTYNGQLYGFTKGHKSRPFMYMTWLWGTQSAHNIIGKHVRAELRKIQGSVN